MDRVVPALPFPEKIETCDTSHRVCGPIHSECCIRAPNARPVTLVTGSVAPNIVKDMIKTSKIQMPTAIAPVRACSRLFTPIRTTNASLPLAFPRFHTRVPRSNLSVPKFFVSSRPACRGKTTRTEAIRTNPNIKKTSFPIFYWLVEQSPHSSLKRNLWTVPVSKAQLESQKCALQGVGKE